MRRMLAPELEKSLVARSLAELLIVIVGVLIALAVNDWSSNQNDRKLEREYLNRLLVELREDSVAVIGGNVPRLAQKKAALDTVRATLNANLPITDTLAFLKRIGEGAILGFTGGYTSHATFDEMNNTGTLRLISNPKLKADITSFYNDAAIQEGRITSRFSGYGPYIHTLVPSSLREMTTLDDVRNFGIARTFKALHSDQFYGLLNSETNFTNFMNRTLREMSARRDTLMTKVGAELSK